jgi:hypothetical protein
MGTELDIDDVCAGHPRAKKELDALREALRLAHEALNEAASMRDYCPVCIRKIHSEECSFLAARKAAEGLLP